MSKSKFLVLLLLCMFVALPAFAKGKPGGMKVHQIMLTPDELKWAPLEKPDLAPGLEAAVLEGDPKARGPVTLRLKIPAGYKIPAHYHDGVERVTVLSGKLNIAMGKTQENPKAFPAGGFFLFPPKTVHNAWADEETIVQVNTHGPWTLNVIK